MKIKNPIEKFKTFRKIPDSYWFQKVVELGVNVGELDLDKASGSIYLKKLDISLPKEKYDFLLKPGNLRVAKTLKRLHDARFSIDKDRELFVEIEGIRLFIQTEEELEILREIYIDGTYNIIYDRPLVVWDIGMNTGFVSLALATQENVQAAIGYEPFKMTYEQALRNLQLNPNLAKKIKAVNNGVGGKEENLEVEYAYECKASVGVNRMPEAFKKNNRESLMKEEIRLLAARDVLESIRAEYPETDIAAKIDCEGSEYDILGSLYASQQLHQLKLLMIEWHEKGPEQLVDWLRRSGFAIFSRRPKSKTIGTLYAVRGE